MQGTAVLYANPPVAATKKDGGVRGFGDQVFGEKVASFRGGFCRTEAWPPVVRVGRKRRSTKARTSGGSARFPDTEGQEGNSCVGSIVTTRRRLEGTPSA